MFFVGDVRFSEKKVYNLCVAQNYMYQPLQRVHNCTLIIICMPDTVTLTGDKFSTLMNI